MGDGPFLGFNYLEAMVSAGRDVRACPIGPAYVAYPPWAAYLKFFTGQQPVGRFVNVVCAPLRYAMGQPLTGVDVGGLKADPGVVYQPQTAISGLHTPGVVNVAVTLPVDAWDEIDSEIQALHKYDLIVCPSDEHAIKFREIGVSAICVPPSVFSVALLELE